MRAMLAATIGFVRNTAAPLQPVRVDLTAILAALVEQERDLARDVTLAPSAIAMVNGDPMTLERLFQNLIDNGIAYGGTVSVSLERDGGNILVKFADRGPGLPDDMLARVFQPFVRGDPSRNRTTGGIGLGLTIARTIAEDHGGGITLNNRAGGGLLATVRLPLAS
jgi:two-component system, OmpR family, sensor kinase